MSMHKIYILIDKFTKPILPPLLIERDYGKYEVDEYTHGRLCLVSGDADSIANYVTQHQQIWLGFLDSVTEDNILLEYWTSKQ